MKNKTTESNQTEIKVSAIVSVYNSEKFIKGCLDDLTSQTLYKKGELEIVVVNSGSQQKEEKIIFDYQKRFEKIKYIKTEEREGIYTAWNRGIKAASGKYITNANTDDRHKIDALEIMYACFEKNENLDVVYANSYKTIIANDLFESDSDKSVISWVNFDPDLIHFGCFLGPHPMWKKKLHDSFGYFAENLFVVGDYEFWLRISRVAKFYHLPQILGLYLYSETSAEHRNQMLTDKEHKEVQKYYMSRFVQSASDVKRIKSKLEKYANNPALKEYLNSSLALLNERENAIGFESGIVDFIGDVRNMEDSEVAAKIDRFIKEIEEEKYLVDKEQFLELLYLLKASYSIKRQNIDGARKCYEMALNANGNSSLACSGLAELFLMEGNSDAAKEMFEWALKINPDNQQAKDFLAGVNEEHGGGPTDNSNKENV